VAWIREHHPDRPLVLFGWSLGAAAAIGTAARHPAELRGLVALSPWTSLPDVARLHFPGFVVQGLLKESYDSLSAARQIHVPSLVMHGTKDPLIPVEQGTSVAGALAARWIPVTQAAHNDLLAQDEVWEEVARFLDGIIATK
jgi:pimeloyl-ACP methyl ester carboxylesterase